MHLDTFMSIPTFSETVQDAIQPAMSLSTCDDGAISTFSQAINATVFAKKRTKTFHRSLMKAMTEVVNGCPFAVCPKVIAQLLTALGLPVVRVFADKRSEGGI